MSKLDVLRNALIEIVETELAGWGKDQADVDCLKMSNIARTALKEIGFDLEKYLKSKRPKFPFEKE